MFITNKQTFTFVSRENSDLLLPGKQSAMFVSNFSVPNLGSTVGVIDRANDMHACAYLDQVESKTVTAEVAWENVRGYFTMSQSSPFDSTWTNFSVSGLGVRFIYFILFLAVVNLPEIMNSVLAI